MLKVHICMHDYYQEEFVNIHMYIDIHIVTNQPLYHNLHHHHHHQQHQYIVSAGLILFRFCQGIGGGENNQTPLLHLHR